MWTVRYEDGDAEELPYDSLRRFLRPATLRDHAAAQQAQPLHAAALRAAPPPSHAAGARSDEEVSDEEEDTDCGSSGRVGDDGGGLAPAAAAPRKYFGVSRARKKFQAGISVSGMAHYLGIFATPDAAARAYGAAVRRLRLVRAVNFPKTQAERDTVDADWRKQMRLGSTPQRRRAASIAAQPGDDEDSSGGSIDAVMQDAAKKAACVSEQRGGGRKVAADNVPSPDIAKLRGIRLDKTVGAPRWRAVLNFRGKQFRLGSHGTPKEAGRAYDAGVRRRGAPLLLLNYPTAEEQAKIAALPTAQPEGGGDNAPPPHIAPPLPLSLEALVRAITPPLRQVRGAAARLVPCVLC